MRKNSMSGSRWQGMETRHGDGTEALSQETESNRSATPKSWRHPLTLPTFGLIVRADRIDLIRFSLTVSNPSLVAKKIKGHPDIWEARIDIKYRLTFMVEQKDGETPCILRSIDNHDECLKNP
jgi:hypothetical protein